MRPIISHLEAVTQFRSWPTQEQHVHFIAADAINQVFICFGATWLQLFLFSDMHASPDV